MKSNRVFQNVLLLAFFQFLLASCGSNSSSNQIDPNSNYKLEIFDSLQFDILSRSLWIADVDTKTGDMLVIQPSPPKAWLFDKSYNPLSIMELPNGDPKGTGQYVFSGTFFEDGIALMGHTVVNLYDREFNLTKSMKPNYGPSQLLMPGYKHIYDFQDESRKTYLVTYYGQPQTSLFGTLPAYYDEFNLVDVVDPSAYQSPKDSVFIPFGELTSDSRYKAGKAFYMLQTRFSVSDDLLYYSMNDDTTLYVRSLPKGEILESYSIPFDKFILFDGYSMGKEGVSEQYQRRDRSGRIETVYHTGEFEVVIYHSGLKMSEMEVYDRNAKDFYDQLERIDHKKYLIIKDGKRVNTELALDPKVFYLEFVDDNGIFYGMQNSQVLDHEPEKYTIYKMRIVEDN